MNTLNPFDLLDRLLNDYASPKARRTLHTIILLAVALVGIWLAAEGDWREAGLALLAALYAGANKANTPEVSHADVDEDDDGLTYEEAGGQTYPVQVFKDGPRSWSDGDPHRY